MHFSYLNKRNITLSSKLSSLKKVMRILTKFLLLIFFILIITFLIFLLFSNFDHINLHVRTVVTLTTTPTRINKIRPTLESLVNQTRVPNAIYLNVPYHLKRTGEPYVIPEWLKELPEVTVVRCEDYGPATKLI